MTGRLVCYAVYQIASNVNTCYIEMVFTSKQMIMGGYGDRCNGWNAMLKKASNTMEGYPVVEDYFH